MTEDGYRLLNPMSGKGIIILCDHGGDEFADDRKLGLDSDQLQSDVVCDWGTSGLAAMLGERTGCFTIISRYSRLIVDLNRYPGHADCIPEISQRGFPVPGNSGLSQQERNERLRRYFWPYHNAVTRKILDLRDAGHEEVAIVSIHSFASSYHGVHRPWELGILFAEDERLSAPFIEAFSDNRYINLGRNEPYTAMDETGFGFSVDYHGVFRAAPHIMLEVRQDELTSAGDIGRMAACIKEGLDHAFRKAGIIRS